MTDETTPLRVKNKNGHGLTDVKSRGLKPTVVVKGELVRKRYPDGNGLFLVVSPAGSKWWDIGAFEGKKTCIGFGVYSVITLAMAREKHLSARWELAEGRNPSAMGKKDKWNEAKVKSSAESTEAASVAFKTHLPSFDVRPHQVRYCYFACCFFIRCIGMDFLSRSWSIST
ncbi:hypothetical protein C4J81_14750 [Deltaproteobacteria bacterium Smac51]|nr:hypothetical protein C4J81_14750 [Deltaproteobacteria bacterium Smac51]